MLRHAQDERVPSVAVGNQLAVVTSLLSLCGWLGGINYTIEQPSSSVLSAFPAVAALFRHTSPKQITTHLGAYGGDSAKPLRLWSTARWADKLARGPGGGGGQRVLSR